MTAVKIEPRLKAKYKAEIKSELQSQFGFKNVNQVPGLTKIVVNMGSLTEVIGNLCWI